MSVNTESVEDPQLDLPPHPPVDTPGGIDLTFRADVEGLRAVAVTIVVFYHVGLSWFRGGFVGVDVFFVISGFLITGLLIKEHDKRQKISIVGFYARRARRILPAAMIVIMATVFLAYFMQNFIDYGNTASSGRWAALFAANIHFALNGTNYFDQLLPKSPLQHYWSLAVEEQFYLVWPLLVLLLGLATRAFSRGRARRRKTEVPAASVRIPALAVATVATVGSFVWSLHQTWSNPTWAYYSPLTRAWELGLGAVLACSAPYAARIPKRVATLVAWGGLLAIFYACAAFTDTAQGSPSPPFPGWAALVPVLGAGAVILGGSRAVVGAKRWQGPLAVGGLAVISATLMYSWGGGHPLNVWCWVVMALGAVGLLVGSQSPSTALLGVRPVRAVGRVSYGWYLLHYPLMILMVGAIWTHPLSVEENMLIAAGTLIASFAMFAVLERPIRRSPYLARRPWVSVALGATFIALAFLFCYIPPVSIHNLWTT